MRTRVRSKNFDDQFMTLLRSAYKNDDKRPTLKAQINSLLGATMFEEQSYTDYCEGLFAVAVRRLEVQRHGIHTVAMPGGLRPVWKHVTKMRVAFRAFHLRAAGKHRPVIMQINRFFG